VQHARTIVDRGTSANRQIACFNRLVSEGAWQEDALKGVVDHLIAETLR
jgi:carboxylate-amine ligase